MRINAPRELATCPLMTHGATNLQEISFVPTPLYWVVVITWFLYIALVFLSYNDRCAEHIFVFAFFCCSHFKIKIIDKNVVLGKYSTL